MKMDVPVTLENIPFMWGIAFLLDVIVGFCMFAIILRKSSPSWSMGAACWIGWWSWASAFTLIINMVVGTTNPFSYHQIGVLTESMTNIGMLWWIIGLMMKNWYVRAADWELIERLRADIYTKNWIRAIKRNYQEDREEYGTQNEPQS